MSENHLLAGIAIAGAIWAWWERKQNTSLATGNTDSTNFVPWYLNYNTSQYATGPSMSVINQNAIGIENDVGNPTCTTCSMFGSTYGSQY